MKHLSWFQLVLGLWVLVSPWVLGFYGINTALWSNIAVGILIIVVALWELFGHCAKQHSE